MEYLRTQFHEELTAQINNDGNVEIEGYPEVFSPYLILREMDQTGYEEVFNEWLNERRTRLKKTAESILNRYDNLDRFTSLKKTYENGAVIPFVGAGMSITSGYPGWADYLRSVCEETEISLDDLNCMLRNGEYEEAAQVLHDDMGAASFNEHLNNKFGNIREPLGPVNYLPLIFKGGVITTNFDPIIETVYESQSKKFSEIMLGTSADEFRRFKATGCPILLKLHGHGDRLRDRVLTLSEYNRAYTEQNNLMKLVSNAFFNETMLFLGCSLSVDRTIRVMTDYVHEHGHENLSRHYAFIKLQEGEDRRVRRRQLVAANIFPIWYEDVDHDEALEALLLLLTEGVVEI